MTHFSKAALLVAALAVAGCTSPSRFGEADASRAAGGAGAGIVPGSVDDPSSPAYFSERVGDRVLFAVDQHTLSPEAQATLDAQARWLMANPDYMAIVEGHADEQGTRDYNISLSNRRANAAMEYLISRGVAPGRLKFVGYGKERPIEICSEEVCYAKNRRAVTVIAAGALTG